MSSHNLSINVIFIIQITPNLHYVWNTMRSSWFVLRCSVFFDHLDIPQFQQWLFKIVPVDISNRRAISGKTIFIYNNLTTPKQPLFFLKMGTSEYTINIFISCLWKRMITTYSQIVCMFQKTLLICHGTQQIPNVLKPFCFKRLSPLLL